ncbi:MAG: hypothetical protein WA144_11440 [Candidatus Methanoperedens sp.]
MISRQNAGLALGSYPLFAHSLIRHGRNVLGSQVNSSKHSLDSMIRIYGV